MKTHCKVLFGAMAFVVASFSGSIAGLTVNNGTASGDETGTLVTVTAAAAPAGTHFVGWSGDVTILANPSYIHDDCDDSVYGGNDHRDLHSTSDESHSRT